MYAKLSLAAAVAVTILVAVCSVSAHHDWEEYKNNHNKTYGPREDAYRKEIFLRKVAEMEAHNNDTSKTYKKGINQFTDMTAEEFRAQFTGAKPPSYKSGSVSQFQLSTRASVPASIDWRTKNVVTPVKDQGQCGSCWAFSTTGAVESAYAIKHGSLISLSEEFLVDCDTNEYGCDGGWPDEAMNFIQTSGGIPTESAYPYTAGTYGVASSCQNQADSGVSVTGTSGNGGSESTLQQMVGTVGPVSVCVDAGDGCDWSAYESGIFNEPGCYEETDHAVLAVGYSTSGGYWIVKNSWGTSWGESGYIRLAFGSNMCGIADYGYVPASN